MKNFFSFSVAAELILPAMFCLLSCESVDSYSVQPDKYFPQEFVPDLTGMDLPDIARMLSALPIGAAQTCEVHDAVTSSLKNGYDEEYTMNNLFGNPGYGVGDTPVSSKAAPHYDKPLRSLIEDYILTHASTKGGSPDAFLDSLASSDIQIYWPYSDAWDGSRNPVITFNPETSAETNIGYERVVDDSGNVWIKEVTVDEKLAVERPVWVVNRNDDAGHKSIEMLRRENPQWAEGGTVVVKSHGTSPADSKVRSLTIKSFRIRRNYDPWFAGASEFFIKCGAVEDFSASTEEEMKNYNPSVTDFMVVVPRRKVMENIPFDVMLVSNWTDQLEDCAFMVTEDDGGTRTSWKCSASVKVKTKSYGFDVSLPFNTRDDIVWRGKLSRSYLENYNDISGRFGDVDITFRILER